MTDRASRFVASAFRASGPALFFVASLAACSAAPDATREPDRESTARSTGAITNGTPVASDAFGSVMMWICTGGAASCCPSGAASCDRKAPGFAGGCSGTMLADRWLLTAHHCVTNEEVLTGGTPIPASHLVTISADRASLASGAEVYLHPTLDVALVYLTGSVVDAHGAAKTTALYTGTSASLIGKSVYCQGFGDNVATGAGSGYGTLRSSVQTVNNATTGWIALDANSSKQALYLGDSGTACFYWPGLFMPYGIVGVQSLAFGDSGGGVPTTDTLAGADGFSAWASDTLATASCTHAFASCGTVSDPFGHAVSCGTCASDETCTSNRCVCTPQACRYPMRWSTSSCRCEFACKSPAACCTAAGGYWDGKYCS